MVNIINRKHPAENLQIYISILRNYIKFIPNHHPIRTYPLIAANILKNLNSTRLLYCMIYRFTSFPNRPTTISIITQERSSPT